jgi:hypothetical protein
MSILSNVEQFFENLWNNVLKPDVEEAEQVVDTFFVSAESAVENELGVAGLKIVTDAVAAAENAGGTGVQKLAAATGSIVSNLSAANILNVATNTINVAIEAAVSAMNSAKPSGTTNTGTQTSDPSQTAGNDNNSGSTDAGSTSSGDASSDTTTGASAK